MEQKTVGNDISNSTGYAIPVAVCVTLVIAILNRFYADLGIELIGAIGAFSGALFNVLYSLARFFWKKYSEKIVWDD